MSTLTTITFPLRHSSLTFPLMFWLKNVLLISFFFFQDLSCILRRLAEETSSGEKCAVLHRDSFHGAVKRVECKMGGNTLGLISTNRQKQLIIAKSNSWMFMWLIYSKLSQEVIVWSVIPKQIQWWWHSSAEYSVTNSLVFRSYLMYLLWSLA